jgi:hypothetical protein
MRAGIDRETQARDAAEAAADAEAAARGSSVYLDMVRECGDNPPRPGNRACATSVAGPPVWEPPPGYYMRKAVERLDAAASVEPDEEHLSQGLPPPLVQKAMRDGENWRRRVDRKIQKQVDAAWREETGFSRQLNELQQIRARLKQKIAARQRLHGREDRLVRTLERYGDKLALLEQQRVTLKIRVLARYAPLDEAAAWEELNCPAEAVKRGALDLRMVAGLRAAACSTATTWLPWPKASFPNGVPIQLLDDWAVAMATRARHRRLLLSGKKLSKNTRKRFTLVLDAARRIADCLTASNQRERWWLSEESGRPVQITAQMVLWRAHDQSGVKPPRSPGASANDRKQKSRETRDKAVERAFGDVCADAEVNSECKRTRAGGVRMFALDHIGCGVLGRGRSVRTEKLRKIVLAHVAQHGVPPPWLQMRCTPCHTRRHRREALRAREAAQAAQQGPVGAVAEAFSTWASADASAHRPAEGSSEVQITAVTTTSIAESVTYLHTPNARARFSTISVLDFTTSGGKQDEQDRVPEDLEAGPGGRAAGAARAPAVPSRDHRGRASMAAVA